MAWALSLFMGGTVLSLVALPLASRYAKSLAMAKASRFDARGRSETLVWLIYTLSMFFNFSALILLTYPLFRLKTDEAAVVLSLSVKQSTIFMYSILATGVVILVLTEVTKRSPRAPGGDGGR